MNALLGPILINAVFGVFASKKPSNCPGLRMRGSGFRKPSRAGTMFFGNLPH
jgi:hypothetical protein